MSPMAKRRTSAESGEDLLIARHFKPIARHPGALGLVDDAALLAPPAGHELVLTADAIVGGVHFFPDDPPDAVARKALGVNLSDLAAKGAKPAGFLLTLALAEGSPRRVAQAFCARARRCGEAFRLSAARRRHRADAGAGDDLDHGVRHRAQGHHGQALRRARGRPYRGHRHHRRRGAGTEAPHRPRRTRNAGSSTPACGAISPRAISCRGRATPWPRRFVATPMPSMDVSDGLAGDLGKLLRASGVGATVEIAKVPLSKAARTARECRSGRNRTRC